MTVPNPPDDDLQGLVRQAQSGDEQAFRRLVELSRARIFRWALVKTGDADEADDVTQTVLVRLSTHLDRYDGRSRFTTWLYRVTANAAGGLFRRHLARRRAADAWYAARKRDAASARDDPLEQIHAADLATVATAFFTELPARQREVFDLADLQGLSAIEIGQMLRMKPATVRVHLLRARRALRRRMLERFPALEENRA